MGVLKGIAKNVRKKVIGDGKSTKQDEKFMTGHPTRMEVANYVNALMEEHYMPQLQGIIQMSSMVLQAILIKKNVCTGEEIKEITEEFMKEQEKRMEAAQKMKNGDILKEVMTPEYFDTLHNHVNEITAGKIHFTEATDQSQVLVHVTAAASMLKRILFDSYNISDSEREKVLQDLVSDKRDIETDKIKFDNTEDKTLILGMLWDAIIPFAHKKLTEWDKNLVDTPSLSSVIPGVSESEQNDDPSAG